MSDSEPDEFHSFLGELVQSDLDKFSDSLKVLSTMDDRTQATEFANYFSEIVHDAIHENDLLAPERWIEMLIEWMPVYLDEIWLKLLDERICMTWKHTENYVSPILSFLLLRPKITDNLLRCKAFVDYVVHHTSMGGNEARKLQDIIDNCHIH